MSANHGSGSARTSAPPLKTVLTSTVLATAALLGIGARADAAAVPSPAPDRGTATAQPSSPDDAAPSPTDHSPRSTVGGRLLAGRGVIVSPGVKAPPKTKASSFLIADADTGAVLAAKDPHGRYAPASTLKMLTAVTLIPKLDKKRTVKPSEQACNVEGSAVGIVPEPIYKVDDLMRALLMVSANDAAEALAEANGGMRKTLADMNREARRLQAYDTVAKTPHGLDRPGQRSSAYDLALIARAGLAMPDFRRYISTKVAKFPAPKDYDKKNRDGQGRERRRTAGSDASRSPRPSYYEIGNHNRLLGRYPGMIGVKNGWTSKALGSFVGAATRDGHTIIVVIMRHPGVFWEDVASLLDWGFANRTKAKPIGELVKPVAPSPSPRRSPSPKALPVPPGDSPRPAAAADAAGAAGAAGAADDEQSPLTIVVATLAGSALLIGGGAGFYAIRRRRRADHG